MNLKLAQCQYEASHEREKSGEDYTYSSSVEIHHGVCHSENRDGRKCSATEPRGTTLSVVPPDENTLSEDGKLQST